MAPKNFLFWKLDTEFSKSCFVRKLRNIISPKKIGMHFCGWKLTKNSVKNIRFYERACHGVIFFKRSRTPNQKEGQGCINIHKFWSEKKTTQISKKDHIIEPALVQNLYSKTNHIHILAYIVVRFFSQSDLSTCRAFFLHKKIPSGRRRKKKDMMRKQTLMLLVKFLQWILMSLLKVWKKNDKTRW